MKDKTKGGYIIENNRAIGKNYEDKAADYLVSKGYRIIDTNYKIGRNTEIDIIAKDRNTVVFVEVKYRSAEGFGHPLESVGWNKQVKICEAARRYIYSHKLSLDMPYRFDVIGILGDKLEHIENAFLFIGRK